MHFFESGPNDTGLILKLRTWLSTHPQPDVEVLAFLGRSFTPRQLVDEVEHQTEVGRDILGFLHYASSEYRVEPDFFLDRAISANRERA